MSVTPLSSMTRGGSHPILKSSLLISAAGHRTKSVLVPPGPKTDLAFMALPAASGGDRLTLLKWLPSDFLTETKQDIRYLYFMKVVQV